MKKTKRSKIKLWDGVKVKLVNISQLEKVAKEGVVKK